MPIYEYHCQECGKEFEKRMSFAQSDEIPVCPFCESEKTNKKLSLFCATGVSGGNGGGCASCAGGSCNTCGG
jgi:putative FmdB family regulatory protein